MPALLRILLVIPLAFIVASVAAGFLVAFALVQGLTPQPSGIDLIVLGTVGAMGVGAIAALPMLLAVIFAEVNRWRSLFYWLAIGALIGAGGATTPLVSSVLQGVANFVLYMAYIPNVSRYAPWPDGGLFTIALAAGLVLAFVYWLIAGRSAGTRTPSATG